MCVCTRRYLFVFSLVLLLLLLLITYVTRTNPLVDHIGKSFSTFIIIIIRRGGINGQGEQLKGRLGLEIVVASVYGYCAHVYAVGGQ